MRAHTFVLSAVLILVFGVPAAHGGDLFVICHASVGLKADAIRDMYFGDKAFEGTVKLAPADNSAAEADFLEKVMKLDAKKYAGVWIKKAFRDGSTPPPVKASDAEAIAYVKVTPGACSYVASSPGDGVDVVAKF